MSLPLITVTGQILLQNEDPATGYVEFRLTDTLFDMDEDITYSPVNKRATLDEDGRFEIELVATSGPGGNPTGIGYRVHLAVQGTVRQKRFVVLLPHDIVQPVDIADLPHATPHVEWVYAGPPGPTGPTGPEGPQGPSGGAEASLVLPFSNTDQVVWNHGLNKYPEVLCIDDAGHPVLVSPVHSSPTQLVINFSKPRTGVLKIPN